MAARPAQREAPAIAADVHLDMFGTLTIRRAAKGEQGEGDAARLPVPSFAMKRAVALRWADLAQFHQPALAAQVRAACAEDEEAA